MRPLKTVFMGTPAFAVAALAALVAAGHDVVCAYTREPRPARRGQRQRRTPVHEYALANGIGVRTPRDLRGDRERERFAALDADVAVVAAYGLILPAAILAIPRRGCVNVHASLLPRWRGAAPIQRAIAAGDRETGVTLMQMDEGLDTGPILLSAPAPIGPGTTAPELHDRLAGLGARLVVEALGRDRLAPRPQPETGVTWAPRLTRDEGRIDWSEDAAVLERRVRAFQPWPGTWCEHDGLRLRVLKAAVVPGSGLPGTVVGAPLTVACGRNALALEALQRAGGSAMDATAFLRGRPLDPGATLA